MYIVQLFYDLKLIYKKITAMLTGACINLFFCATVQDMKVEIDFLFFLQHSLKGGYNSVFIFIMFIDLGVRWK